MLFLTPRFSPLSSFPSFLRPRNFQDLPSKTKFRCQWNDVSRLYNLRCLSELNALALFGKRASQTPLRRTTALSCHEKSLRYSCYSKNLVFECYQKVVDLDRSPIASAFKIIIYTDLSFSRFEQQGFLIKDWGLRLRSRYANR